MRLSSAPEPVIIVESPRVDWLCQCGNGRLAVPEEDVPDFCPMCGYPIAAQYWEED